jgi:hypothetical protein
MAGSAESKSLPRFLPEDFATALRVSSNMAAFTITSAAAPGVAER